MISVGFLRPPSVSRTGFKVEMENNKNQVSFVLDRLSCVGFESCTRNVLHYRLSFFTRESGTRTSRYKSALQLIGTLLAFGETVSKYWFFFHDSHLFPPDTCETKTKSFRYYSLIISAPNRNRTSSVNVKTNSLIFIRGLRTG